MAISVVVIATATCHLFLDIVFEGIEERIWFIYIFWFSCRQFLFTMYVLGWITNSNVFFREYKREAIIRNDDVIVLMTSSHL